MSYKITIKKNFLKENCGDSAAPTVQDVPVQGLPLAGDVSTMTPEAAYDAGRTDAINEIMAVIEGMVSGGIPVDMAIPADIMQMDQLEEEDEPLEKLAKGVEKRGTEGDFSEWCGGKVTQSCIDRAAKEGGKRAKQASLAATFSKAKGGGPTLKYPKKNK